MTLGSLGLGLSVHFYIILPATLDPFVLPTREPVELPDHDGVDHPVKDGTLHLLKRGTSHRHPSLDIFKPSDRRELDAMTCEPPADFRLLTVRLLPSGRHAAVTGDHDAPFPEY